MTPDHDTSSPTTTRSGAASRGDRDADTSRGAVAPGNTGAATIVFVALGLMVFVVAGAFLFVSCGAAVDGAALLESAFGVRTLGEGYEVVEAREVPLGARVVVVEDRRAAPEAPAPVAPDSDSSKDAPKVEWKKIPITPSTAKPRRLVFVFPKDAEQGVRQAEEMIKSVGWSDVDDLGDKGGRVTVAKERIAWRGFDADWVHHREYEPGPAFRDTIQVNLSLARQPCLLTATWPRGESASRAQLEALLASLSR